MVRQRAGVSEESSVTYEELLRERRRELAFESQTWFDTQRYRYREGNAKALEMINDGYGTGYNRCAKYVNMPGLNLDITNENDRNSYVIVQTKAEYADYDPINLTDASFRAPLPASVSSSSPSLAGEPVDYFGGKE